MTWTKEYCGLSYLGELRDERRATLRRFETDSLYQVTFWQRGYVYGQRQETFTSERKAKAAAEVWCGNREGLPDLRTMIDEDYTTDYRTNGKRHHAGDKAGDNRQGARHIHRGSGQESHDQ